mmetsp:Transcript_34865/g.43052  ORF Transcript_34865/g.43052 Transcript_34865/m.43052 type:complete len:215 (+) Transcript_34865:152-796(+)
MIIQRRSNLLALKKERRKLAEKQKFIAARLIQKLFHKYCRRKGHKSVPETESFQQIIATVDELVLGLKHRKNNSVEERIKKERKANRSKIIPVVSDASVMREKNKEKLLPPINLGQKKKVRYGDAKGDMKGDVRIENNYKWSYKNQMNRIDPMPPQHFITYDNSDYFKTRKKYDVTQKLRTKPMGERKPWSNYFTKHNQENLPKIYRRGHANVL